MMSVLKQLTTIFSPRKWHRWATCGIGSKLQEAWTNKISRTSYDRSYLPLNLCIARTLCTGMCAPRTYSFSSTISPRWANLHAFLVGIMYANAECVLGGSSQRLDIGEDLYNCQHLD